MLLLHIKKLLTNKIFIVTFYILISCITTTYSQIISTNQNIKISVSGHPELTSIYTVDNEGMIDVYLIGKIPVIGMSIQDLQRIVRDTYSKLYPDAIISVSLTDEIPINYSVLGAVKMPGRYKGTNFSTLQSAIVQAGGTLSNADLNNINLIRGKDRLKINLYNFLKNGNLENNPSLRDNDIIFVPIGEGNTAILVYGEVKKPGYINYYEGITLFEAIVACGGFTENADLTNIKIIKKTKNVMFEKEYNLKKILKDKRYELMPTLSPGDIILVQKKKNYWSNAFMFISNLTREFLLIVSIILTFNNLKK